MFESLKQAAIAFVMLCVSVVTRVKNAFMSGPYALAERLVSNRVGSTMMAESGIAVIVVIVILAIGIAVVFPLLDGLETSGWPAAGNTTLTSLETGIASAYTIGNLLPLVGFAVAIIGAIVGVLFYFRGSR